MSFWGDMITPSGELEKLNKTLAMLVHFNHMQLRFNSREEALTARDFWDQHCPFREIHEPQPKA